MREAFPLGEVSNHLPAANATGLPWSRFGDLSRIVFSYKFMVFCALFSRVCEASFRRFARRESPVTLA
jgi:hypothetical protein